MEFASFTIHNNDHNANLSASIVSGDLETPKIYQSPQYKWMHKKFRQVFMEGDGRGQREIENYFGDTSLRSIPDVEYTQNLECFIEEEAKLFPCKMMGDFYMESISEQVDKHRDFSATRRISVDYENDIKKADDFITIEKSTNDQRKSDIPNKKFHSRIEGQTVTNGNTFRIIVDIILGSLNIFESYNIKEVISQIIVDEKARSIKVLVRNLLRDLDKSQLYTRQRKNTLKFKSPLTCFISDSKEEIFQENKEKIVKAGGSPQNYISDIIQICKKMSTTSAVKISHLAKSDNEKKRKEAGSRIFKSNEGSHTPESVFVIGSGQTQKLLSLSPLDTLIKSHFSKTDRRLRAIGNKTECSVKIFGPFSKSNSTAISNGSSDKTSYQCSIIGDCQLNVERCLRCIKDTFPTSTMREIE